MKMIRRGQFYGVGLCFVVFCVTSAQNVTDLLDSARTDVTSFNWVTDSPTTPNILDKWKNFEKATKKLTSNAIKAFLPNIMSSDPSNLNISSSCMKDVLKLIAGLRQIKTWAFSFIDASGKTIDGMLLGSMAALGDYDQCVETEAIDERRGRNYGKVMFTGKYCSIDIKPPLPPKKHFYKLTETLDELKNFSKGSTVVRESAKVAQFFHLLSMRYGICIPSGCQESDVSQVTSLISKRSDLSVSVRRCELKPEKHYSASIIAIMTVYSFFGLLVLIGSIVDLYFYYSGKKIRGTPLQLLGAFSFVANFKRLINTDVSSEHLRCLSGIRTLSITWIILGHTYLNINFQLFRQLKFVTAFSQDLAFSAIVNATVAVDTFFVMGGFLGCYLVVKLTKEKKKPLNIPLYIFHRLFRILPIYSMVVAFMFLAPLLGYGPVWHDTVDYFVDACYSNWWSNFLFINNFLRADKMCLPQSWYVASDMQLYIVALVILLPLLRWPKIGLGIATFGILVSMISSGTLTYVMDFPPTMLFVHPDHDQRIDYWSTAYFKPYSHAGPYFVGMILGYFLATKPTISFSLRTRCMGWCFAVVSNLAVLYGVYEWNNGRDPNLAETIFYSSCHRVAWALGVSWVILNCATGQGGVVNYILSWRCWTVLGRLTYSAYLIHPIVQITAVGNLRMQIQPWHYFAVWMYFGHLAITYGCAFVATMLVEAPFMALEKVIFKKAIDSVKETANQNGEVAPPVEDKDVEKRMVENRRNGLNGHAVQNGHTVFQNGLHNKAFLNEDRQISRL